MSINFKKRIERKIEKKVSKLRRLESKYKVVVELSEDSEENDSRTSYENYIKGLEIQEKINFEKRELNILRKKLNEIEMNKTRSFIEKESEFMAKGLKKYIDKNQKLTMEKSEELFVFRVRNLSISYDENSDLPYNTVPNVIMEILHGERVIVKSRNIFLRSDFYTSPMSTNEICCTHWFREYEEMFYKVLREMIEKSFKENPKFRVVFIDKNRFKVE